MIDLVCIKPCYFEIASADEQAVDIFSFLLVDSLYLCQFITCIFLNKGWEDLKVSQIIFRGHLFIQSIVELKILD